MSGFPTDFRRFALSVALTWAGFAAAIFVIRVMPALGTERRDQQNRNEISPLAWARKIVFGQRKDVLKTLKE